MKYIEKPQDPEESLMPFSELMNRNNLPLLMRLKEQQEEYDSSELIKLSSLLAHPIDNPEFTCLEGLTWLQSHSVLNVINRARRKAQLLIEAVIRDKN